MNIGELRELLNDIPETRDSLPVVLLDVDNIELHEFAGAVKWESGRLVLTIDGGEYA